MAKLTLRQQILAGNSDQQQSALQMVRPVEATDEQWAKYQKEVRENERIGMPNPCFGVDRPWEKKSTSRKTSSW